MNYTLVVKCPKNSTTPPRCHSDQVDPLVFFSVIICLFLCRHAASLANIDSDDVVPFSVATGDVSRLVKFFTNRGQLYDAFVMAAAANEGGIAEPDVVRGKSTVNGNSNHDANPHHRYEGI